MSGDDFDRTVRERAKKLSDEVNAQNNKLITAKAHLKTAEESLEEDKKQAMALFGTSDIEEIKRKVQEKKDAIIQLLVEGEKQIAENNRKLSEIRKG